MSVTTTADKKIESAKNSIDDAIKSLAEVVINKTWGWDEYSDEYLDKLFEAMAQLRKIDALM